MKNIDPYTDDSFTFHKEVIKSKNNRKSDPLYKERVQLLNPAIEPKFILYFEKFNDNDLEALEAIGYTGNNLIDLQGLYRYNSKLFQKLKIKLTTDKNNRISNTCQNCTVGEVNSFDHYLPQSEFAEFSVNPLNLVPCCTTCNTQKNASWRNDGKRKYINLYLDKLPESQYLFVNLEIIGKEIIPKYFLENRDAINPDYFELIINHYANLDLFTRFKGNSDKIISELAIHIDTYKNQMALELIKDTVIEECSELKKRFGSNYWPIILKRALVENEKFLSNVSLFI